MAAAIAGILCFSLRGQTMAQNENGLRTGDSVAICGDSITEQKLYSVYMEDYLLMCGRPAGLDVMQFGWAGETANLFEARQKSGCLIFKPTVATILYGMNDAGYSATTPSSLGRYRRCMSKVVENFKQAGLHLIVLGSPGVVDSDTFWASGHRLDPAIYNRTLGDFAEAARKIASEQGVVFADVHTIMMDTMAKAKAKYGKKYEFAGRTGIHPGPNGHLVMAYALLKALGCKGDIGTITVDLKGNSATATEGQKILSVSNGNVEVESTRYPFCFYGDPAQATTRSIIEFLPFNEDLNRYKLIVKNAAAPKLRVTWGKDSRVFAAADLEKGINLAAEFLDNPFSEPFAKTEKIFIGQQSYETNATKLLLHSLPIWQRFFPDRSATFEELKKAVMEKEAVLQKRSRAAVVPVKHTITIQPAQ